MIASLFTWLRERTRGHNPNEHDAGSVAKERLSILLLNDRIQLPPPQLEALKQELLAVIAKYVEVDTSHCEIGIEKLPNTRQMAIVSNIPVKRVFKEQESVTP